MEKSSETLSTFSAPTDAPKVNVPLVSPEIESFAKSLIVFRIR